MKPNVVVIHPDDNVAVALADIAAGGAIQLPDGRSIEARTDIAFSHKVALVDIGEGADVLKYGEVIGQTRAAIEAGEWVHTHNLDVGEETWS